MSEESQRSNFDLVKYRLEDLSVQLLCLEQNQLFTVLLY